VAKIDIEKLKQKIREKAGREVRSSGNPNQGDVEREIARSGRARNAQDIPKQDTKKRNGETVKGNAPSSYTPSTIVTRGVYRLGPPQRPNIQHDAGFSNFPKGDASLKDHLALLKWYAMLEGAEMTRGDLTDALAAYRHFHEGEGKAREFSYERYVANDTSGRTTLHSAILEAQHAALELWAEHKLTNFQFTGPAIPCGNTLVTFPYPATENWQKAIGAHVIWLSGTVTVVSREGEEPHFTLVMTLHAEDQYNFNPGAADIATGMPDDENGRFEVLRWAHGYRHTSTLTRSFNWVGTQPGVAGIGTNPLPQNRQPRDNRRSWNRF
jgi:hypothetical protein